MSENIDIDTDESTTDVEMTEAMVHDLLKRNQQLSVNLRDLHSAYDELRDSIQDTS